MLELPDPDQEKLVEIAKRHFPRGNKTRIKAIAELMQSYRKKAGDLRRRPPGTAEFLDAIRACEALRIEVSDEPDSVWKKIENAILIKDSRA